MRYEKSKKTMAAWMLAKQRSLINGERGNAANWTNMLLG